MDDQEIFELIRYCKKYPGQLKHLTPEFILREFRNSKNSMSECERQPVGNNEQGGNKFLCYSQSTIVGRCKEWCGNENYCKKST